MIESPPRLTLDELGVEAELQQEVGLDAASELRVGHLVAPRAQARRPVDTFEEVRVAAPPVAVEEHALVDDLGARPHCRTGSLGAPPQALEPALALDRDDLAPGGTEGTQVRQLVLIALSRDELGGVGAGGLQPHAAVCHLDVQVGEVRALEELDEVRGREDQPVIDALHAVVLG
jgi:hypothetical protein